MNVKFLSGNALKLLALISMTLDHIGLLLFPGVTVLRALGRLALPIFGYMISEGARYTKSRPRYLLVIALMGAIFQLAADFVGMGGYLNIFLTFTLSIIIIYSLDLAKSALTDPTLTALRRLAPCVQFLLVLGGVFAFTSFVAVDYGFGGVILPVLASIPVTPRGEISPWRIDTHVLRVLFISFALVILALGIDVPGQWLAFAALPLLLAYSGKRGRLNLKYFFYLYYPAHLLVIGGIYYLG